MRIFNGVNNRLTRPLNALIFSIKGEVEEDEDVTSFGGVFTTGTGATGSSIGLASSSGVASVSSTFCMDVRTMNHTKKSKRRICMSRLGDLVVWIIYVPPNACQI